MFYFNLPTLVNSLIKNYFRCIRVDLDETGSEVGYQFSVKLVPDITDYNVETFLEELHELVHDPTITNELPVDVYNDVCPQAGITYLEKVFFFS